MHHDFIGQELRVGDFVAYPGGGNTKCEYGMILQRITALRPNGDVQIERLDVNYPDHKTPNITRRKSTIKSLSKLAKVNPSNKIIKIFENPDLDRDAVAKWLHGTALVDWEVQPQS